MPRRGAGSPKKRLLPRLGCDRRAIVITIASRGPRQKTLPNIGLLVETIEFAVTKSPRETMPSTRPWSTIVHDGTPILFSDQWHVSWWHPAPSPQALRS